MIEISLYLLIILITCMGGYFVKSLSVSGAIATFFIGVFVAIGFQWPGLLLLGVFFVTSSFCSMYKKQQKKKLGDMLEKGSARDWIQVAANGSVASLAAILYFVSESSIWLIAFIISVAAANADTWASELGVLSKNKPFYILTWKRVEKGTSGAVSALGTVVSLVASLFIILVASFLFSLNSFSLLIFTTIFGYLGSALDTLLGATIQARYSCVKCKITTEKTMHCNLKTTLNKGMKWCNNDIVNFLSIFLTTALGTVIYTLL